MDASARSVEARLMRKLDEELGTGWRDAVGNKRNREVDAIEDDEENNFSRGNVRR